MLIASAKNSVLGILQVSMLAVLLQVPGLGLGLGLDLGLAWAGSSEQVGADDTRLVVTLDMPSAPVFSPAPSGRMSYSPPNPTTLRQQLRRCQLPCIPHSGKD